MKKIMVIDGESLCLKIVIWHLERNGFKVIRSDDSSEALRLILKERPAAIVTDIQMPGMNGWELIRVVRSWTQTALIPVIFLTELDSEVERMRGFQLGADDYLVKPVHAERLLAQLENVLDISDSYLKEARRRLKAGEVFRESMAMFSIPSFLSLLEELEKSGTIVVESDGQRARLQVNRGKLFHAEVEGATGVDSLNSIHTVLAWPAGEYRFEPGLVQVADLIGWSTAQILVEAATVDSEGPATVGLQPSQSGRHMSVVRRSREDSIAQSA